MLIRFNVSVLQSYVLLKYSICQLREQVGIRLRAAIIDTIYRKALRIAASANNGPEGASTGQIVNLLAVDLQRLQDVLQFLWGVWYAPLNIIIAMVLLYMQVFLYIYIYTLFISFLITQQR